MLDSFPSSPLKLHIHNLTCIHPYQHPIIIFTSIISAKYVCLLVHYAAYYYNNCQCQ